MSILKGLARALVATAALPIDVVADVVTLGGVNTNQPRTYTGKRLGDLMDALDESTSKEER